MRPSSFTLTRAKSSTKFGTFGVQEYFAKPTLMDLLNYFSRKSQPLKRNSENGKEKHLSCKTFANNPKNRFVTGSKLSEAWQELRQFCEQHAQNNVPSPESIVVLGTTFDRKIRLAIISGERMHKS
jgi:hypothetical protein